MKTITRFLTAALAGIFAIAPLVGSAADAQSILKDSDQARGGGLPGIVW